MRMYRFWAFFGPMLLCGPALALDLPATLAWGQRVELGTHLAGLVATVEVIPGQRVEKGRTLVRQPRKPPSVERSRH